MLGGLVDELLRCQCCLELFTDPHLLPCAHRFCLDCLDGVQCLTCRCRIHTAHASSAAPPHRRTPRPSSAAAPRPHGHDPSQSPNPHPNSSLGPGPTLTLHPAACSAPYYRQDVMRSPMVASALAKYCAYLHPSSQHGEEASEEARSAPASQPTRSSAAAAFGDADSEHAALLHGQRLGLGCMIKG